MAFSTTRRAFAVLAVITPTLRPVVGFGQSMRTVGVLDGGNPEFFLNELRKALAGLGYREGKDIRFEVRGGKNDAADLRRGADELVRLNVDLIATRLTPATRAAKEATQVIPIVMSAVGGPVEVGFVASLARPGGNITGMSTGGALVAGKRLQIMRETLPHLKRVAMAALNTDSYYEIAVANAQKVGRDVGIEILPLLIGHADELEAAFARLPGPPVDALLTLSLVRPNAIAEFALRHNVPLFGGQRNAAEAGALMSYGGRLDEQYRGAAIYVDKILKGTPPASLPIVESSRFELVINIKTGRSLGITIPPGLMAQADDLIE